MLFFFSLIFSWTGEAEEFSLRSLRDVSVRSFELEPKGVQVFMIFQKDCGACREQVKEMLCLKSPVYLLGAFSSEKELRGETHRLGSRYPAYLASGRFLSRSGGGGNPHPPGGGHGPWKIVFIPRTHPLRVYPEAPPGLTHISHKLCEICGLTSNFFTHQGRGMSFLQALRTLLQGKALKSGTALASWIRLWRLS